jgi:hypothetical protein
MHGWRLGLRCWFAQAVGPWFLPAWYVAPAWKRDKWHRIACDDPGCVTCAEYYERVGEAV